MQCTPGRNEGVLWVRVKKQAPDLTIQWVLYGTSACHLCELAEQMLEHRVNSPTPLIYKKSDISLSDDLFERYGLKIPVLRHTSGRELDWPFSDTQLDEFLQC